MKVVKTAAESTLEGLERQRFCRDKHVFVATNTCLSRQNTSLSGQKDACRDM